MVNKKNYWLTKLILLSALCVSLNTHALSVTAERQIISINETLRLSITDNDGDDPSDIDLSGIEANFSIVNESSQSSYSMINGRTESVRTRVLMLAPRKLGSALIPPLTLNKKTSQAIKIKVIKALPVASELNDQSVILESLTDTSEVMVGAQLIYTYRVVYRVQLNNAEITPPSIDGAEITELQDKNYTRTLNGKNYNVTEKRYAIFFNQAGQKTIPSQTLTALLSNNQRRNFGFDPFARGSELRLESKPLTINVQPQPSNKDPSSAWLPAAKIELTENTAIALSSRVGEPITRSISVMAQGLPAELLPTLTPQTPDGINSYPEKPELVNQEFIGGIAGKRTDTIAMVPTQAGTFTLPAINLPWWNTTEQRWETASLPAKAITVLAAEPSATDNKPISNNILTDNNSKQSNNPLLQANETKQSVWMPIALVAIACWLITLLYLLVKRSPTVANKETSATITNSAENSLKAISKKLQAACKNNDAASAKQQLQLWLATYNKNNKQANLNDAVNNHTALNNAISELDNFLFNQHAIETNWDGTALLNVIQALISASGKSTANNKKTRLAPLYPDGKKS